jgi:Family of unknown function (DUF6519)
MQGDFSRWTFDPQAAYRAVLLQQGRVVLDADWNEQTQITAHHDEVRTLDIVGRAGGPIGQAAFGITDPGGNPPKDAPWTDLRITPGRFYVDGVLAEVEADAAGKGPPMATQPYLPVTAGNGAPGLPEPAGDGRYAAVLELHEDHVTPDEVSRLRESALGGPDTSTRSRTIWQLTLKKVANDESCANAQAEPWLHEEAPTMTASLADVPAESDPCRITTSAGYRRLENQLYRVQIHEVNGDGPTYLWSRENGSVVAGLTAIDPSATMDAELSLDREGRDEELSIRDGDIVEVTSTWRRFHGLPGFLATAGAPDGQTLPVDWRDDSPADFKSLGEAPIVRRWEGEPRPANPSKDALEDGIEVSFGAGDFHVGDYWLIPARTVRLVYGQTALAGTIEWPTDDDGKALPRPPVGTLRHRAVVALLDRATTGGTGRWTFHADCRRLTPPMNQLVSLDLLGGDGQEALPGTQLPHPIRVVVRNGGLPVAGAPVRFTASGGDLTPSAQPVLTGANGQAEVRWQLPTGGASTQSLTATLLDDVGTPVGAEVRVSARLSVATQVGYDPAQCPELASADTVQEAIDTLCKREVAEYPGINVEAVVTEGDEQKLLNDSLIEVERLDAGLRVIFDDAIGEEWAKNPVLRLTVDLPWPLEADESELWGSEPVGWETIALRGEIGVAEKSMFWHPDDGVREFLLHVSRAARGFKDPVLARLTVLGRAVKSKEGDRWLNGLALGRLDGNRIDLDLPSVDDVHAADFTMWFWLKPAPKHPDISVTPQELTFIDDEEALSVIVANKGEAGLSFTAEARTTLPARLRAYEVEPTSGELAPATAEAHRTKGLSVSALMMPPSRIVYAGELVITSNDPDTPTVTVPLTTMTTADGIIPLDKGALRLKAVRDDVGDVLVGPRPEEEVDVSKLRAELGDRPLRLGVAPGFESAFIEMRDQFEAAGISVERVVGEPAELTQLADAGELQLDGIVGDAAVAGNLSKEIG